MDPQRELERMLKEHGAVLVRDSNHPVYRLPNGQTFVASKSPSDHRSTINALTDLRRALGIRRAATHENGATMGVNTPAPPAPSPAQPAPAVEEPKPPALKSRLEAAVAIEESRQEKLMAEAQQVERRVQMLRALLPYVDDATAEDALRAILPAPEPSAPPKVEPPPAPPEFITERVQVTRELVRAAIETFETTFTINDVMDLMTGGRHIDPPERVRVRASIGQAMLSLLERGEVIKEADHFGRRQAIWRKATLQGTGKPTVGIRA